VQKSYFMLSDAERAVLNTALDKYRPGQSEPILVGDKKVLKPALRLMTSAFEQSDPPARYIVGVRMRRQKEVSTSVLGSRARWFESVPECGNAKDPAPLKVKEVWVNERRYIVCLG
jgi:hypothetical protein